MQSHTWQAVYEDGRIINQFENDGAENSSEVIDRTQLKQFRLIDAAGRLVFVAHFNWQSAKRKLIFRRRTFMSGDGQVKGIVYLVGWHENVKGVSIKSICYVYEDGHVEFDDDRSDLELVPCEEF